MDDRLKSFLISSILVIIIAVTAIVIFISTEAEDSKFQDASVASIDITTLENPIFVISVPTSNLISDQSFLADIRVVFPEKEVSNPSLNVAQVRLNYDPGIFEIESISSSNNYQLLGQEIDPTNGTIRFDVTNPITFLNGSSLASIQMKAKSTLSTSETTSININTQDSSIGLPNLYRNTVASAVFSVNSPQNEQKLFGDSCMSDLDCSSISSTVSAICNEFKTCANSNCPNNTISGKLGQCSNVEDNVAPSCLKLGEVSLNGEGTCCVGSVAVPEKEQIDGVTCKNSRNINSFVCLSVEDSICGIGENFCNSPIDCAPSAICPEKPTCLEDERLIEQPGDICTNYLCVKTELTEVQKCPEIKSCVKGYHQVEVSKDENGCSAYQCEKTCEETVVSCPTGRVLATIGEDETGCPVTQCVSTEECTPLPPCVYGINLGSSGVFTCSLEDLPKNTNWCPKENLPEDITRDCKLDSNKDGQIDQFDFATFSTNYNKTLPDCSLDIVGNDCKYDKSELSILGRMYQVADICLKISTNVTNQIDFIREKFKEVNRINVKIKLNEPMFLSSISNLVDRYNLAFKYLDNESKNYVSNGFIIDPKINLKDFSITGTISKDSFDTFIKAKGSKVANLIVIENFK